MAVGRRFLIVRSFASLVAGGRRFLAPWACLAWFVFRRAFFALLVAVPLFIGRRFFARLLVAASLAPLFLCRRFVARARAAAGIGVLAPRLRTGGIVLALPAEDFVERLAVLRTVLSDRLGRGGVGRALLAGARARPILRSAVAPLPVFLLSGLAPLPGLALPRSLFSAQIVAGRFAPGFLASRFAAARLLAARLFASRFAARLARLFAGLLVAGLLFSALSLAALIGPGLFAAPLLLFLIWFAGLFRLPLLAAAIGHFVGCPWLAGLGLAIVARRLIVAILPRRAVGIVCGRRRPGMLVALVFACLRFGFASRFVFAGLAVFARLVGRILMVLGQRVGRGLCLRRRHDPCPAMGGLGAIGLRRPVVFGPGPVFQHVADFQPQPFGRQRHLLA